MDAELSNSLRREHHCTERAKGLADKAAVVHDDVAELDVRTTHPEATSPQACD